jgi:hypothetical protein
MRRDFHCTQEQPPDTPLAEGFAMLAWLAETNPRAKMGLPPPTATSPSTPSPAGLNTEH